MKEVITYFLHFIAARLFLPGQVENWIVLTDLNNVSMMGIPYSVEVRL